LRALAAGLALVVAAAPALPALAAHKGDVREDGVLDLADPLLVLRALAGSWALTGAQSDAADVAPMADGMPVGNDRLDTGDAALLLHAANGADVDGDGLAPADEAAAGTSALLRDSDGDGTPDDAEDADADGVSNAAERAAGTAIGDPDGDGDGWVDGEDPLPLLAAGTEVAYIHTDHLGSVRVLTDAAGNVLRRIDYGPFGVVRANVRAPGAPATAPDPEHGYTGQRRDPATGLLDYGARWYDPATARFVTPDSVDVDPADPATQDRYAYARHDPLRRTDPTGHWPAWMDGLFGGDDDFELSYWDTPEWDPFDAFDLGDWGWGDGGAWDASFASTSYSLFDAPGASAWQWSFSEALYPGDVRPGWYDAVESSAVLSAVFEPVGLLAWRDGNATTILYSDLSLETRTGGTWSWRNNNPGNLIATTGFAPRHGAIGRSGEKDRFAVFPDEATGTRALEALLRTETYRALTLDEAIYRYAPPRENRTLTYQRFVRERTGLPGEVAMGGLARDELEAVARAIRAFEGWRPGTTTRLRAR
jgi:RHS repeat-associated protein